MRNFNRPFIPANDYNEINSLYSFAGMNGRFDLHITQPHSEVYCGYFRRLGGKTDTPDSESGVRSRSSESGDSEEYLTDCFDYICKCTI